ncbi:MAG: nucleotidyltransferase domain-containing protein [candidate division Zixibacteria bacterium]|nr:nucleotidyltransferase domain-containing protein [candidate division Zixibacteria bacterium]
MKKDDITREEIIATLVTALKPLNYVYALWEGGSASFNRIDQWSDIDLYLVVEEEKVEDNFNSMEQNLLNLSEIEFKFRLPEPAWHGHSQIFYRLKKTSPFLFLDIVVIKKSSKDKFLQFRIHGEPVVYFDKIAVVKDDPIDPEYFLNKIQARLEMLKTNFDLFQVLILKELNRGNDIEALSYCMAYTYRPLVEVLRIKYCPYHHNFHNSYIYYDLPPEVVKRLHKLNFIANSEDLRQCRAEAEVWFWEVMKSINPDDLKRKISAP